MSQTWISFGTRLLVISAFLCSLTLADEPKNNFEEFYAACKKAGGTFNGFALPSGRNYYRFFNFPKSADDRFLKDAPTPNFEFSLWLSGTAVTDEGMKEIARFKTIDELDISKTAVGDAGLKEIAKLTKLHTLSLAETKVTDDGLKELLGLENLKYLDLSRSGVKGNSLKQLSGLKNLTNLVINNSIVTDKVLEDLEKGNLLQFTSFASSAVKRTREYKVEDCQRLILSDSPLTDKGIKQVVAFKNVLILDLSNTGITDEGLKQLTKLENVSDLNLQGTKITDAGLKSLAEMKSLKRLELGKTKVTSEGVAELKKALPKCLIYK